MLINVRISELLGNTSNSIALSILVPLILYPLFYNILPFSIIINNGVNSINQYVYNLFTYTSKYLNNLEHSSEVGDINIPYVTSKLWDGFLIETNHITSIGNIMYTSHSIWIILTSIILLLAMVGTIVITIKQKEGN